MWQLTHSAPTLSGGGVEAVLRGLDHGHRGAAAVVTLQAERVAYQLRLRRMRVMTIEAGHPCGGAPPGRTGTQAEQANGVGSACDFDLFSCVNDVRGVNSLRAGDEAARA